MRSDRVVYFITHPEVLIDPAVPVPAWPLSPRGRTRMTTALSNPWMTSLGAIWSSTERKAQDGAAILAGHLGLPFTTLAGLGENDRSATGYLPRGAFEALADQFFAHPQESVRGWERAINAQRRIVNAVETVIGASEDRQRDIAIVAHGGVGALLSCHLHGVPISRAYDQPAGNGGSYFAFSATTRRLLHGWQPIDA